MDNGALDEPRVIGPRRHARLTCTAIVQRVRAIAAATDQAAADPSAGLRTITEVRAWLDAQEAVLSARAAATVSFPEQTIAECTRTSLRAAERLTERAASLARLPALASALGGGRVTAGHVDAVTAGGRRVDADHRAEFLERADQLTAVAAAATVPEFRRRIATLVREIDRTDEMERLARQQRATTLRTWTDHDGMWCLEGRFDPVSGLKLASRLDAAVEALFAEAVPDSAPSDPLLKQRHLQALALARLIEGDAIGGRPGRPEFVAVIEADADGPGGPVVDWGLPIEIPTRVLAQLAGNADVHAVVVRNGVVLHAPGALDLGRTTRLANRAQRRALRAMHRTCAVPGCAVHFDRCTIHHVTWWRHGGRTDLINLLPLCTAHHVAVHDKGWIITLGPNRELTLRLPDGTIHCTGPPGRRAA